MTAEALARQERAARHYSAPGDVGLKLHEAYRALMARDLGKAARLAQEVSLSHPDNVHPWLILGIAALDQLQGATAQAFFQHAHELAPENPEAISGLGKARVLQADAFGAVKYFERAIEAGSQDMSMVRLYKDLMCEMNRQVAAAEVMTRFAERTQDAELFTVIGELYLEADQNEDALRAFDKAYALDPSSQVSRLSHVKALHLRQDYAGVAAETETLLGEAPEQSELISLRMAALRHFGLYDEALALLDAPFHSAIHFKRAVGVAAHIHLDRGDLRAAGQAFRHALYLTDEDGNWAAKAYGTFCLSVADYETGARTYAGRHPITNRARIPYHASAPDNLTGRKRLFLMQEQGIGDQLALLPLAGLAPLADGAELTYVGEARMAPVIAGNRLNIGFRRDTEFDPKAETVLRAEIVFIGDLVRYVTKERLGAGLGGYLRADPTKVVALRARYATMAGEGPIVGIAWKSKDRLTGLQRSITAAAIVAQLPPGTLAVNLQYGDCKSELAEAAAANPAVSLYDDPEIDQLTDLGGFMAQIMALDRVVTIDNTTAHACGALGHSDTHLIVPTGAECMWYWQRQGDLDPWYGRLRLHRQARPGDWSRPLAEIGQLPRVNVWQDPRA